MISIILPTYNRRELLVEAIHSILKQRFQDWELIVVDDGSTDQTQQLVRSLREDRIRCLYQPHKGVSAARNAGIEQARFPWITFLDSDDCWRPAKLQRQLEELERCPAYRVVHSDEIWIRRGRRVNPRKIHRKYGGWIYHRCLPLCTISPSSVLLHRTVLQEYGVFDETYPVCEDYELWLRLSAQLPILFLDEPLVVKQGGHAGQLSKSRWGLDRYRVRALIKTYRTLQLTPSQRVWTAAEIVRKATILCSGFQKRNKVEEAQCYRSIVRTWKREEHRWNSPFPVLHEYDGGGLPRKPCQPGALRARFVTKAGE
ncbi:MAG: glycosyltransferase family 2 protein [Acidobacteriota bacterium]